MPSFPLDPLNTLQAIQLGMHANRGRVFEEPKMGWVESPEEAAYLSPPLTAATLAAFIAQHGKELSRGAIVIDREISSLLVNDAV